MAVFISYARDDAVDAQKLYTDLKAAGAEPWLDQKNLRGGQRWESVIRDAISRCQYFIALLSSRSVDKRGYVQKEVRQALDLLERVPELDIFVIPVRLDACQPSISKLKELHWIDVFPNWNAGVAKLLSTMGVRNDGTGTLETLKRIYLEADGDEERMLEAIRGLKRQVDKKSFDISESEWQYIERMCPGSIVDLLKNLQNNPGGSTVANPKRKDAGKEADKGGKAKKK